MTCLTRVLQINDHFSILCCLGMENLGLHEVELSDYFSILCCLGMEDLGFHEVELTN